MGFDTRATLAVIVAVGLAAGLSTPTLAQSPKIDPALATLINGPQRSAPNSIRDKYRNPAEVLGFFGVKQNSVVVEILPGAGGYWTEILGPYLKDKGRYIAANGDQSSTSAEVQKDNAG